MFLNLKDHKDLAWPEPFCCVSYFPKIPDIHTQKFKSSIHKNSVANWDFENIDDQCTSLSHKKRPKFEVISNFYKRSF